MESFELLIVGAGPVGCVIAERAANVLGWRSVIVEKRDHIAGNCYDRFTSDGLMIHQYGPHYFRSDNPELLRYLSTFTEWIPGNYRVKASHKGELYPIPINLNTLRQFFKRDFTATEAEAFLEQKREKISNPKNSEEFVLSRVGRELYEAFYLGYTLKQWEKHPRELDTSVCGRIPIRFNEDDRYVNHQNQLTPKLGFTALFQNMIRNPLIHTMLQTDYREAKKFLKPSKATIYCGPVDEYFDYSLGKLPWRSLRFEFKPFDQEFVQPCVQINYPSDHAYTRTVEIKHVTGQKHPRTVVSYEYPTDEGDPYYPVPAEQNQALYRRYEELARAETAKNRVYFSGRLAQYKYLNTDEAIEGALKSFETLRSDLT